MKRVNKNAAVWNLVGIGMKYVSLLGLFLQRLVVSYIEKNPGQGRNSKWAAVRNLSFKGGRTL